VKGQAKLTLQADVVIVGGGPAGIATAIAAGQKGLRAVVVDARKPPIDKACGEGLLPEAVASLRRLGIHLDLSSAFPFSGIRFTDEHSSTSAKISDGQAFGLRRTRLQQVLVGRAEKIGVSFLWGTRVTRFDSDGAHTERGFVPSRWIVGADGQNSRVRKCARIGVSRKSSRFGFRRHFCVAPWTDLVEVHWGERCQMILTPTGTNEICASFMTSDPQLRIERALGQFPEVESRLRRAQPATTEIGSANSLGLARSATRKNVALVGDASCTVDGVSGQGLSLAFQEALALGDALAAGDLGLYETAHRRITGKAIRMAQLMLLMDRSAWIRRKALRLFAAQPGLFSKIIAIHMGETSAEALNASAVFDLGWQVLRA
jgi:menaquinone-9 beta-reductase